jgi:small GTP-binding protein
MNNNQNNKNKFQIILLGDSEVGKTCLFHYFSGIKYKPNYMTTVGIDDVLKTYEITKDNQNYSIELKIYDTSGQERYKSISNSYYKKVNGAIFMYDVTNKKTFKNINNWILELKNKSYSKNIVCGILGNKIDKIGEIDVNDDNKIFQNEISDEEINEFKEELKKDDFNVEFEKISAKFGTNVDDFMKKYSEKLLENKLKPKDENEENENNNRIIVVQNAKKNNESGCCLFKKKQN